jgi:hypothetical protein
MLDPLADLRVAALTELRGEWLIKNWFVEPSGDTLRLLREAGKGRAGGPSVHRS